MSSVTVRDLRNNGGDVLDRVVRCESFVVTSDGAPVAASSLLSGAAAPLRRS